MALMRPCFLRVGFSSIWIGCELFLGREAFIISPSQVVSNVGGCHAAAFLLVGTPVGLPLAAHFPETYRIFWELCSSIKFGWIWSKGSKLAADRKKNASNETEQSHKPVSTTKRRLNTIFTHKKVFYLCGKLIGYFFAALVGMPGCNSCKQYQ